MLKGFQVPAVKVITLILRVHRELRTVTLRQAVKGPTGIVINIDAACLFLGFAHQHGKLFVEHVEFRTANGSIGGFIAHLFHLYLVLADIVKYLLFGEGTLLAVSQPH